MSIWYSQDRLKPLYGRRRVRKLCDHIDSLKIMLDRVGRERDAARAERDGLREAAWWVVMHWDNERSQHGTMGRLREAVGLPPEPPTREEAQARLDEYLRDPSLWGRA